MTLSIIVPVFNEAAIIRRFLAHVREVCAGAEIILADGGSNDGTLQRGGELADEVVQAGRNRAVQMNAGARRAGGDVLWFVHADSTLPRDAVAAIARALDDRSLVGGCFRVRYPRRAWIYRVSDSLGNIGVEVFGFALGDHGIFCRRENFAAAGGYPELPLLEDAELYRALGRAGRMRQLPATIVADPRRYEELGAYRTTFYYGLILAAYVLGASDATLLSLYRRLLHERPSIRLEGPASAAAATLR